MTYKSKFKTKEEAWAAQQYRWKHCGLIGRARFIEGTIQAIIDSPSTTLKAKVMAKNIGQIASALAEELKIRIDPAPKGQPHE